VTWKRLLIPLSAVPVILLLGYGLTRDPRAIVFTLPGRPAPDFTLETLDGDTINLASLRGQVVLLNFWASWCVACVEEHEVLVEAEREYGPQGLRILGVVHNDTRENARRWMELRGGEWTNLLDPGSRVAVEYSLYGVPETVLIARDGRVVYKQIGPVTRELLAEWVPRLLAEPAPSAAEPAPQEARLPETDRAAS
jgi:cytochrome c biogenesis protein CcmG/thiol:disulfide interchange protein DsbE